MRFKLTHPLPRKCWVAVSGGVDSISVLDILHKPSKDRINGVIHINHGTGNFANAAEELVKKECEKRGLTLLLYRINEPPPPRVSKEKWWRDRRYEFFNKVPGTDDIVLGHNFDDNLEQYLISTLINGYMAVIPYRNNRCVRPFRLWKRKDIETYATNRGLKWVEDPSNKNTAFKRNYVRHELIPRVLEMNPGVYNIVRRLVEENENRAT